MKHGRKPAAIAAGGDPAADRQAKRNAETVAELSDLYADAEAGRLLTKRKVAKKPSTLRTDRGRIERHIKPLLGRMAVADVDRGDVDKFLHDVAAGKTAARVKTGRHGLARVSGGKGTATRKPGTAPGRRRNQPAGFHRPLAARNAGVNASFRVRKPSFGSTRDGFSFAPISAIRQTPIELQSPTLKRHSWLRQGTWDGRNPALVSNSPFRGIVDAAAVSSSANVVFGIC